MAKITNEVLYNEIKHIREHLEKLNGNVLKNTAWRHYMKGSLVIIAFILSVYGLKIFI